MILLFQLLWIAILLAAIKTIIFAPIWIGAPVALGLLWLYSE